MNLNKADIVARYQQLKTDIRAQVESNDAVCQNGERVEVSQDFSLDRVIIKAGSAFDDDPKTEDSIQLTKLGGGERYTEFEEEVGCFIFKRTNTMMTYHQFSQTQGGFSTSQVTFPVS